MARWKHGAGYGVDLVIVDQGTPIAGCMGELTEERSLSKLDLCRRTDRQWLRSCVPDPLFARFVSYSSVRIARLGWNLPQAPKL